MRAWREPIYLLENAKGKVGSRRPWMQGIRESKYDFSKMEEAKVRARGGGSRLIRESNRGRCCPRPCLMCS